MARIKSIFRLEVVPEGAESVILVDFGDHLDIDQPFEFSPEREHQVDAPINNTAAYFHDGKTVTSSFTVTKVRRYRDAGRAQRELFRALMLGVGIGKCDFKLSLLDGYLFEADAIMTGCPSQLREKGRETELITTYNFTLTNFRHERQKDID